jgi:hypothetical protein
MRSDASILIPLGFSNQARLIVDQVRADVGPMPFDNLILTRGRLVEAFQSEGQSLIRCGEGSNPKGSENDDPALSRVWQSFADLTRSKVQKTFVLSNADHALGNSVRAGGDFDDDFGLGRSTFDHLTKALDRFGARNYAVTFLSRSLAELEETASSRDPKLDHRFVGTLSLRQKVRVAASLFGAFAEPALSSACGAYDGSRRLVKAINSDVAIIYEVTAGKACPFGSLTKLNGGFAAFFEGHDQCLTAVGAQHGLYFSDGARWMKDAPVS